MSAISNLLTKAWKAVKGRKFSKATMKVVLFYLFFVVLLLFTWYGAWVYEFASSGKPDLETFSKFIVIVLGATGFFGFIVECFVDKNHNGIPDKFEGPPKRSTNESNRHI